MASYRPFFSVFLLAALHTVHVYCDTSCVFANQTFTCLENFECCDAPECCKISKKPTTILGLPELIGVIVAILVAAAITVGIVICICSRYKRARKEAASPPEDHVYPPTSPKSPSIYYSETNEYVPRTNPYHANKEWQERRAWSMAS